MSSVRKSCGWLVGGFGIGVLMMGCATVRVPIQVTHPAEINMAKYKQVAITKINGNLGQNFEDDLKGRLVDSGRFTLVDRARLDQIMRELHLSNDDLTSQSAKAAKMGQLLPATAIITGHIKGDRIPEKLTYTVATCYRDKNDKRGYPCRTYTRTGAYLTNGSLDVIDVGTGQIVKSKLLNNRCQDQKRAPSPNPESIDYSTLAGTCLNKEVTKFMKAISPWTETVQAPFRKDAELPQLESGINMAKTGDMVGAADTFQAAAKSAEMNPKVNPKTIAMAYWNMGLAYQYSDQFSKGIDAFKKSCVLDPSDECFQAIKNCEKFRRDQEKLVEQNKPEPSNDLNSQEPPKDGKKKRK